MIQRVLFLLLLMTGCQLTQLPPQLPTPTKPATPATVTPEATMQAAASTATPEITLPLDTTQAVTVSPPSGDSLLAWLGTGSAPERATGGKIALIDRAGAVTPLMDVPNTAARVSACGDQPTSPDGRYFAFYVGADAGSLYLMNGAAAPVHVDDVSYLACLSAFRYSPDSQRFAYIDYTSGATRQDYAAGMLRIDTASPLAQVAQFDHAVAYHLDNSGAVFVSFFDNSRGEADEADITQWGGTSQSIPHTIVTLTPSDTDCRFTSAQIGEQGTQLLAVMGQRCRTGDTGTRWQLYAVDAAAGSATLIGSDAQPGPFVTFARTNNLYFAPNGSTAYFTVPDAVTAYTVAVAALNLKDYSITVPVDRQAVFPNFSGAANAFPRLSADARWLALVITSPDAQNQVFVLDLNAPDAAPITSGARSRGDTIPNLAFAPSGDQVVYVAGGIDNALYALDLKLGTEQRIVRGNFAEGLVLAPDGKMVALLNLDHVEDPHQPHYLDLVLASLADGSLTTLYPGADIADGKVSNLRFAYPLAWR